MRLSTALLAVVSLSAQEGRQPLARAILKELIEINTTDSAGDTTRAAEVLAMRFRVAGFPEGDIHVDGPAPRKHNLVVRLHGSGAARPILFIGHLDVVEANGSDWSFDPFQLREQDGYFYGRGTEDMKGGAAILVTTFLRLKSIGFRPARDLVLALTTDEEGGPANGIDWLLKNHRDWIDAEFCVNADGGGGHIKNGKRLFMAVQAAEKVFVSFKLESANPGGHSSLPIKDNAIYHLAGALTRLAQFDFPVHLFDVTRANFERMAPLYGGQLGADMKTVVQNSNDLAVVARLSATPLFNALLRTTCVATLLSGGHAENALPQMATAVVNCRMLPVDQAEEVEQTLQTVVDDPKVRVTVMTPAKASVYPPMNSQVLRAVTAATLNSWPGIPVVPQMETGATDGLYLRGAGIPTFGVSGIFFDEDDVRAHGRDERILVKSFNEAIDFMDDVVTTLAKAQ